MSLQRPVNCTNKSPHVKRLFALLNETDMTLEWFASQICVNYTTVRLWASHRMPRIDNLEAAFNVLGRTLVDIEEIEDK